MTYVFCIPEPKRKPMNCPSGWKKFQDDNSCLKAFNEKKTFKEARKTCQDAGGDVVIVNSLAKNDFVRGNDRTSHYIVDLLVDMFLMMSPLNEIVK